LNGGKSWQEFPDVENWRLVFRELFCVSMQIEFLKMHALTEEIHTIFYSKNFYILHFFDFSNCHARKIGPWFSANFFRFHANRVFHFDRLNRGFPYDFSFKKLLLFTFFSFFKFVTQENGACFFEFFCVFDANRVFKN
jgi:hypothetical protein